MEAQLRELIPFLRDRNPQVRQIALSNLLPQTPKGSPHRNIFFEGAQVGGLKKQQDNEILRDLKLLCRDQLSVSHDAFRALVNLSDSPMLASTLSEPSFLSFIVSYIINPQSVLADLASMLLSNLTASSSACAAVLTMSVDVVLAPSLPNGFYPVQSRCATAPAPVPYPDEPAKSVLALPLLVDAFVQGADEETDVSKRARKGYVHFLASVFANLSMSSAGRTFFLQPRTFGVQEKTGGQLEYPLAKLVVFTGHGDTIRRGGVASLLKNCAFNSAGHQAILSPDSATICVPPSTDEAPGIDALPYLLLPLAGPEELDLEDQESLPDAVQFLPPTKTREPDEAIRLIFVETLLLLCHTRWGRDYQREHGVYQIVRAAHEAEKVDKISEHIERLVTLIKGEEPEVDPSEGIEIEDAGAGMGQQLSGSVGRLALGNADDDEDSDDDGRILEV
ncbi:unnamed protein product [Mycena citricolor]|uniref:Protein HGH1 homolog n=1 Tax=Mycena citricolor TaxID=2018698 RepID=A0AAD2Q3Z5_9AGAR|nr:unnamed protein product [Mycena citricolor]